MRMHDVTFINLEGADGMLLYVTVAAYILIFHYFAAQYIRILQFFYMATDLMCDGSLCFHLLHMWRLVGGVA